MRFLVKILKLINYSAVKKTISELKVIYSYKAATFEEISLLALTGKLTEISFQNTSTLKVGKSRIETYFIGILFDHPVKARLLLVRDFALPYYSNELAAASTANSNKCSKLLQNYWDTAINNKYYRQLHAIASLHLF